MNKVVQPLVEYDTPEEVASALDAGVNAQLTRYGKLAVGETPRARCSGCTCLGLVEFHGEFPRDPARRAEYVASILACLCQCHDMYRQWAS